MCVSPALRPATVVLMYLSDGLHGWCSDQCHRYTRQLAALAGGADAYSKCDFIAHDVTTPASAAVNYVGYTPAYAFTLDDVTAASRLGAYSGCPGFRSKGGRAKGKLLPGVNKALWLEKHSGRVVYG